MQPRLFLPYWCALFLWAAGCLHAQTPVWTQFPNSPGGTTRNDDIYFADLTNGWSARGVSGVYRTTNAGAAWTKVIANTGSVAHFRCLGFASSLRGWAGNLGPGSYDAAVNDTNILYETFDGGATWSVVPGINESGMKGFCAMHVRDADHIYGAGRVRGPAYFAKTEDGGAHWTVTNLTAGGVMGGLMDVYFKDAQNGFIVGMDTNAYGACAAPYYHGAIARTTNGGLSWFVVANTPVNCSYFWKMSWPSTNVGYASLQQNGSYNTVIYYKTTDGGATWTSNGVPLSALGAASFGLQGIGFVSESEGWMGGSTTLNPPYSFIHTTNGGLTWTTEGYNNTRAINRIRFVSPTLGYMSGQALHVYHIPLAVTVAPTNQTVALGAEVTFTVAAQGTSPLNYQWRFHGTNLPGASTNTYPITQAQAGDGGNYDVLVSDFSGSVTSTVAVLTIQGVPEPPAIVTQPQNVATSPGSNATFTVTVEGTNPLSYQWRFAGTNLPGATQASFTRTNVLPVDLGDYAVVVTNAAGSVTSAVAVLTFGFRDDFDGYASPVTVASPGTTNGYKILYRSAATGYDFKAIFGFDYSTITYPQPIPSAPHSSGGTTKGLFLTVNKDATGGAAAVNLYPVGRFYSGNYALKFDLWINWADVDSSTEHTLFGINHSGNVTNRVGQAPSDGLFFAVEGEDDTAPTSTTLRDFAIFHGGDAAAPVLMTTNNTVFGPAPLPAPQFDNTNPGLVNLFPAQTIPGYGSTPAGTAGLRWLSGEVRQVNGVITWLLNGVALAQYTNTTAYTNGTFLLGYNDHFNSIGDANNFAVFDNVRVEPLTLAPVQLLTPQRLGNRFQFSFATEPYETYTVQWTTNLLMPQWVNHTNVLGHGAVTNLVLPLPGDATARYFRVSRP